jgi:hypothetical protein
MGYSWNHIMEYEWKKPFTSWKEGQNAIVITSFFNVFGFLGCWVSWFLGFTVSWFLGLLVF